MSGRAPTPEDLALARALVERGFLAPGEAQERLARAAGRGLTLRALLEGEGWRAALEGLPVPAAPGPPAAPRTERARFAPGGAAPVATASAPGTASATARSPAWGGGGGAAAARTHATGEARLDRFELREIIGRGGFGTVYRAFDPQRGTEVALKLLVSLEERQRRRFAREVQATARLTHPGVARLLESGEHEGLPWLALELVPGPSLAERARQGLPPEQAARIMRDVARAVAHAHGQKVLHRDLKPHHVLLAADGTPKVIDFGLAFLADARTQLTRTGAPLGTPAYMAPEQVDPSRRGGKPLDARTDVWGLGATLYHALTGRAPFLAEGPELLLVAVLEQEPEPPGRVAPGVPPALEAVCLRALEKDPRRRYPDAQAFAADLERFLRGEPVEAAAVGRAVRERVRGLALPAAGALVFLLAGVGAWRWVGGPAATGASSGAQGPAPDPRERPAETADERARRVEVEALFERARREPGSLEPAAAMDVVARNACPGVTRTLLERLARGTELLRQAEREALGGASPPEERPALEQALAARDATPLDRPLDPALVSLLRAAEQRVRLLPTAEEPARRGRPALAARQTRALGEGGALQLRIACQGLRHVRAGPEAVTALAAYLVVEADEARACVAALTLVEIGTPPALLAAIGAVLRAIPEGTLEVRVRRDLSRVRCEHPSLVEESARGYLFRAGQLRVLGRLDEAVADCDQALRRAPELGEAWALRGTLEVEREDYRRAIQDLDRALALRPDEAQWLARRGDARRRVKPADLAGAYADLQRAEQLAPDDPSVRLIVGAGLDDGRAAAATADSADAWSQRSVARYQERDWKGALEAAERALALDPDHAIAWSNRAAARRELGDLRGAADDLTHAVSLDGQNPASWANLGAIRQGLGDLQGALTACDQALRLDPRLESALSTRSIVRHHLGDARGALEDIGNALQLAPWKASLWVNRAAIRHQLGDAGGAVEDARKAIALDEKEALAWNSLAAALRSLDQDREALAAFDKAIALEPQNGRLIANRADLRIALGDLNGARDDLDQALKLDPEGPELWAMRGALMQTMGRMDLALRDYDRAVALAPLEPNNRSRRGVIRMQLGDLPGAVEDCEQAVQADPRHGLAWLRRALVREAQGDLSRAVEDAGRALQLEPRLVDAWCMRGVWRLRLSDKGGVEDLRKYLEVAPEGDKAGEIRKLLARYDAGR